jgi:hypothetical protein
MTTNIHYYCLDKAKNYEFYLANQVTGIISNLSINSKIFRAEDWVPLLHQPKQPRPRDPSRPLVLIFSQ